MGGEFLYLVLILVSFFAHVHKMSVYRKLQIPGLSLGIF